VTLRTKLCDVATLTLCARCYRTCYLPLAAPARAALNRPDGTLLIEPGRFGSGLS
jgi:hypothetical protein